MCQQSLLNIQAALYCFTTFLFKMGFSPNFILIFFALSLFGKPYNPNKPKYNHLQYILFISNTVCSIRQSNFYATFTCQLSSQCSIAVVVEHPTAPHTCSRLLLSEHRFPSCRKFCSDQFCISAIKAVRWSSGSGSTVTAGSSVTERIRFTRGCTRIEAHYPESILLSTDRLTARAGKPAVIGKERIKSSFFHFNFCCPRGREAWQLRTSGQVPAPPRPLSAQRRCPPAPAVPAGERRRPARHRASLPPPARYRGGTALPLLRCLPCRVRDSGNASAGGTRDRYSPGRRRGPAGVQLRSVPHRAARSRYAAGRGARGAVTPLRRRRCAGRGGERGPTWAGGGRP